VVTALLQKAAGEDVGEVLGPARPDFTIEFVRAEGDAAAENYETSYLKSRIAELEGQLTAQSGLPAPSAAPVPLMPFIGQPALEPPAKTGPEVSTRTGYTRHCGARRERGYGGVQAKNGRGEGAKAISAASASRGANPVRSDCLHHGPAGWVAVAAAAIRSSPAWLIPAISVRWPMRCAGITAALRTIRGGTAPVSASEADEHICHHVAGHHRRQIMPRVLEHVEQLRKAALR
jgi:hypothetical protein